MKMNIFIWGIAVAVLLLLAAGNAVASLNTHTKHSRGHFIAAIIFMILAFLVPPPTEASSENSIDARLNSVFNILIQELPKIENEDQAQEAIRQHILPITNNRTMSRLILGKWWRRATESQRDRFISAMTTKLVNTYSNFLLNANTHNVKFKIIRIITNKNKTGAKHTVISIIDNGGVTTEVTFTVLERKGSGWGIIDVKAQGISLLMTWKQTISNLIRTPADIEKIITDFEAHK